MKKPFIFLFALVLSFSIMGTAANAAPLPLQDNGGGLIYDPNLNITWYDFSNAADTWGNQVNWANNLQVNVGSTNVGGWRLPSALNQDGTGPCNGYNCTGSEMGYLYYVDLGNVDHAFTHVGPFANLQSDYSYWSGTENASNTEAWMFVFGSNVAGNQDLYEFTAGPYISIAYGLAVHDGDIGAPTVGVPEPATMLLLGLGLVGLAGVRRKFKQ